MTTLIGMTPLTWWSGWTQFHHNLIFNAPCLASLKSLNLDLITEKNRKQFKSDYTSLCEKKTANTQQGFCLFPLFCNNLNRMFSQSRHTLSISLFTSSTMKFLIICDSFQTVPRGGKKQQRHRKCKYHTSVLISFSFSNICKWCALDWEA